MFIRESPCGFQFRRWRTSSGNTKLVCLAIKATRQNKMTSKKGSNIAHGRKKVESSPCCSLSSREKVETRIGCEVNLCSLLRGSHHSSCYWRRSLENVRRNAKQRSRSIQEARARIAAPKQAKQNPFRASCCLPSTPYCQRFLPWDVS